MCTKKKFLFISRHTPTAEQITLAADANIELFHVGDMDAFSPSLRNDLRKLAKEYQGVVCVHALIALEAHKMGLAVGVYQNSNRAPEGEKPSFLATALVVTEPVEGCPACYGFL